MTTINNPYMDEWKKDSELTVANYKKVNMQIPYMHHKYLSYLSDVKRKKVLAETKLENLLIHKELWYMGKLDEEDRKKHGWPVQQRVYSAADAKRYLNADHEIVKLKMRISNYKNDIDDLTSILNTITSLNFIIKNYIEATKFENGI